MDKVKNYSIKNISTNVTLIFSTNYTNPLDNTNSIEKDLKKKGFSGSIIFDLLLSNGNNSNRFISASVDNGIIDLKSFKVEKILSSEILTYSVQFYKKNHKFVERSILSDKDQFLLKHKMLNPV